MTVAPRPRGLSAYKLHRPGRMSRPENHSTARTGTRRSLTAVADETKTERDLQAGPPGTGWSAGCSWATPGGLSPAGAGRYRAGPEGDVLASNLTPSSAHQPAEGAIASGAPTEPGVSRGVGVSRRDPASSKAEQHGRRRPAADRHLLGTPEFRRCGSSRLCPRRALTRAKAVTSTLFLPAWQAPLIERISTPASARRWRNHNQNLPS